jgi:hypothetical protein
LASNWLTRHFQLCVDADLGKELGANWVGTKTFDLGANNNGAKRMVHFLKSYCQRRICENLLKKGLKNKKRWSCTPKIFGMPHVHAITFFLMLLLA